jgi:hypothetical protein
MIHVEEFMMNRQKEYPLTLALALNAARLLASINYIRGVYGRPLMVSSGYRPGHFNTQAGGAKNSAHLSCEAIDILDSDGRFADWCVENQHELAKAGLYMEHPDYTVGWVHLQIRPTPSGNRIFIPKRRREPAQ